MHEFSVAQSIVDTVLKVAEDNSAGQVLEVNIDVGEIALVNTQQLAWFIQTLVQGTIADGMRILWNKVPATIRCMECGYQGRVRYLQEDPEWHFSVPTFECVECNSSQTVITSGRELRIKDISVKFDETDEGEKGDA
ncbi:MAG: hydrogenase maturation nickel metallochaperone HypA/HybF [Thermodesulfobacteriota bacterium]